VPQKTPAVLVLADGSIFRGGSIGFEGQTTGEVVFNTAMTGYQEILTDPSYAGQIVTLTYPHIGNVGANPEDAESKRAYAAGLVIRDLPLLSSSWRQQENLPEYLKRNRIVAIGDIDTRRLTRILRSKGAQNGCIVAGAGALDEATIKSALDAARKTPSMAGQDLAKVVSVRQPYDWNESLWALGAGYHAMANPKFHVVAFDYGVKHNILRNLAERGCRVTVLPATATAKPWFWLVMKTLPVARSCTGWLAPWWPNFILIVFAPVARPSSWCPRQMPKTGVSVSRISRIALMA